MNPGDKYRYTRHNAGAMALDLIFPDARYAAQKSLDALTSEVEIEGLTALLIKPQTFMNLSGQAVWKALKKYGLPEQRLIVLHDEVELKPGEVRHKFGGGHKGHNGLRSIMADLGSGEFHRIRIGVGRPADDRFGIADYLLSFQPESERAALAPVEAAFKTALESLKP
jgi:peptidyl-tRNA hydrolase, PTH1 family